MSRPVCGYFAGSGTTGNIVMAAAEPSRKPVPADATHAAPMLAIEARCVRAVEPLVIRSRMVSATVLAIMPDGIPVRGRDIGCGGANAIPGAKMFGYAVGLVGVRPVLRRPLVVGLARVVRVHLKEA